MASFRSEETDTKKSGLHRVIGKEMDGLQGRLSLKQLTVISFTKVETF